MNKRIFKNSGGGGNFSCFHQNYTNIISKENLFHAWKEFLSGKTKKPDVISFAQDAEKNIFKLHYELEKETYLHGKYHTFVLCDPKRRVINKASVRDRVVHHAVVRMLEPLLEKKFIFDSFASRKGKGLHKGIHRLHRFMLQVSENDTQSAWYLKCDIKKFFDSINHKILYKILARNIQDPKTLRLLQGIIHSFQVSPDTGLPLGNYTSQLLANVYMNELDQFVKRELKVKQYIRYSDDFILLSRNKDHLTETLLKIESFLNSTLKLSLHQDKIILGRVDKGIDFLGYVVFIHHTNVRTRTKKRIYKKFRKDPNKESLASFVGITKHARGNGIRRNLNKIFYQKIRNKRE